MPQERARRVLFPQTDTDRTTGLREAVLGAPDLGEVYSHYRGEYLPDPEFFTNALRDTSQDSGRADSENLSEFFTSLCEPRTCWTRTDNARGSIDIGRDNALKPAVVPGPKRSEVAALERRVS